jgi:3-methyladenine DNA glycosylase AlkD
MSARLKEILKRFESLRNDKNIASMARFGIRGDRAFGIKHPVLKQIAKEIGKDHELALELWDSGYHEARLVAPLVDDPKLVTEAQADAWVKDLNSWDLCDDLAGNLLIETPFAHKKAVQWAKRKEEFVRRAGFAMMAWIAVKDKKAVKETFASFYPLMVLYSNDERNYVKKAISWALRSVGKRNLALNKEAIKVAKQITKVDSKSSRWIAQDVLKELTSDAMQARLKEKA